MKKNRIKRNKGLKFLKNFLSKIQGVISYLLCFVLTFTMALSFCFHFTKKDRKDSNINSYLESSLADFNDDKIEEIKNVDSEIIKNYDFNANALKIEDHGQITDDAFDIECMDEMVPSSSDLVLEIARILEKRNMTYQELLELVTSVPEYNQALQSIFASNPSLTINELIAILQGKDAKLRKTFYVGDSRIQGMLLSGVISEDNSVYGVGYGYNWLVGNGVFSSSNTNALNGAINGLDTKMSNEDYNNIVVWLGVNDYTYVDANTYFYTFEELARNNWSNHNIYIVSVGPVKDSSASSVSNIGINNFNNSLKELVANSSLNNLYYVDLNLTEDSINYYDAAGLHYGTSDYQNIFNMVMEAISKRETDVVNRLLNIFYIVLDSYDKSFNDSYVRKITLYYDEVNG